MKLCVLAVFLAFCAAVFATDLPQELRVPGGVAILDIGAAKDDATVRFGQSQVATVVAGDRRLAIVGIPLAHAVGPAEVIIQSGGEERRLGFSVAAREYPVQKLSVEPKFVNPPADVQARIDREAAEMKKLFARFTDTTPRWRVVKPAQGPWSSAFGLRREFNGESRNPHSGADIAAVRGSDVMANGDGEVVLAKDLYFNGNTVIIDHGLGLLSLYCHLDRIDVKAGQRIRAGEQLGIVGATGRVTGPHLHWSISLNNVRVDPLLFLSE